MVLVGISDRLRRSTYLSSAWEIEYRFFSTDADSVAIRSIRFSPLLQNVTPAHWTICGQSYNRKVARSVQNFFCQNHVKVAKFLSYLAMGASGRTAQVTYGLSPKGVFVRFAALLSFPKGFNFPEIRILQRCQSSTFCTLSQCY